MPSTKYGCTRWRKSDCKVFFMLRGPGGEVTRGWEVCVGWRARARNWVESRVRWSCTGRVFVSV